MYQQITISATHITHALFGIIKNNTTDTGPT